MPLLEWIMDGKSRRWVISYDTMRFCLSQYVSRWDWFYLNWGTLKLMSKTQLYTKSTGNMIHSLNWYNRLISQQGNKATFLIVGFTVNEDHCDSIRHEEGHIRSSWSRDVQVDFRLPHTLKVLYEKLPLFFATRPVHNNSLCGTHLWEQTWCL